MSYTRNAGNLSAYLIELQVEVRPAVDWEALSLYSCDIYIYIFIYLFIYIVSVCVFLGICCVFMGCLFRS